MAHHKAIESLEDFWAQVDSGLGKSTFSDRLQLVEIKKGIQADLKAVIGFLENNPNKKIKG